MPANGAQMCASGTGKRCPDGYHCVTESNGSNLCFLDGGGGAGGPSSGAAGKGGAGGRAGAGGMGQAGAGTGGAGGQQMCEPAFANTWTGHFSTIDSGSVMGPAYTVASGGGSVTIVATRTATAAGPANIGIAFTFDPCADASAFSGVSFSISGQITGCSVLFQVDDTERSGGGNGGPATTVNAVTGTPQTVKLAWSTTGGQPTGPTDGARVAILIWGFSIQPSTTCMANVTIGDLTFY
jgi:hypothetical protein